VIVCYETLLEVNGYRPKKKTPGHCAFTVGFTYFGLQLLAVNFWM